MVPGWGRTIVGWVGVFMFVSCLTGIWLWWPLSGIVRLRPPLEAPQHDSTPTSIIRPASGSCSRSRCCPSPAPGSPFRRCSASSSRRPAPSSADRAQRCAPSRSERPRLAVDTAVAAAKPLSQPAHWRPSPGRPIRRRSGRSALTARAAPAEVTGRRRHRQCAAAHAAAAGDARPNHAPLARRHRHGPGLADRHLPRRHHPGFAVGHRHHHLVASAQAGAKAETYRRSGSAPQPRGIDQRALQPERQAAGGPQRHHSGGAHRMPGIDEPPVVEPMGEDGQRLGGRELRADADPRPGAERQILEAVAAALSAKRSMSKASGSSHSAWWRWSSHGQIETMSPGSTSQSPSRSAADRLPVEARHRRIEPQRFAQEQRAAAAAIGDVVVAAAPAPPAPPPPTRSCSSGCAASRNSVQASALAVVSWPAR